MTPNFKLDNFFDKKRIEKIYSDLLDYKAKYGGDVKKIDGDGNEEYARHLIKNYSFCTSVLSGILSDNLKKKKIVEIGPGYAGKFMLDYLVKKGADAWGIDTGPYSDYAGPSKGRYKVLRFENISEGFGKESTDLVQMKSMYPDPTPNWVWEAHFSGNFIEKIKANNYVKKFSTRAVNGIDNILKKGGYFVCWHKFDDYALPVKKFENKNYDCAREQIHLLHNNLFYLDIFKK